MEDIKCFLLGGIRNLGVIYKAFIIFEDMGRRGGAWRGAEEHGEEGRGMGRKEGGKGRGYSEERGQSKADAGKADRR